MDSTSVLQGKVRGVEAPVVSLLVMLDYKCFIYIRSSEMSTPMFKGSQGHINRFNVVILGE